MPEGKGRSFLSQLNIFDKGNYAVTNERARSDDGTSDEPKDQFVTEWDQGKKRLGLFSCIG